MDDINDSRWRVLPIGRLETVRRAAREAVWFGLCGLGGLLAVAVATGVVIEEVFADTDEGVTTDLILRASLAGILLFGLVGFLLLGVLGSLQGLLTARGLAAAAGRGAAPSEVPMPDEWEAASTSTTGAYRTVAIGALAVLGLFYVIAVLVLLGDPDPTSLAVIGGGGLLLAAIWSGIPLSKRLLDPRQAALAAGLEERWTQAHRDRAAERELTEQGVAEARTRAGLTDRHPGRAVRTVGNLLGGVTALALIAWDLAFQIGMSISHPDRTFGPGRQAGDRASLSPHEELLVDRIELGGGLAAVIAVLALVALIVCEIVIWRVERRELRRALADGGEVPPPHAVLRRAMVSASPPALRLVFALTGAALALGFALWFVSKAAGWASWETYHAASPALLSAAEYGPWVILGALVVTGLGVALGSQLDLQDEVLRDDLVRRWPVRPPEEPEESKDEADSSTDSTDRAAAASTESRPD